jgi:hypothetical protein
MRISGIWNDPIGFVFHITCKNKLRAMMEQDPDGTGKTLEFLDDFEFDERLAKNDGEGYVQNEQFIENMIKNYLSVYKKYNPSKNDLKYVEKMTKYGYAIFRIDSAYNSRLGAFISALVENSDPFKNINADHTKSLEKLHAWWKANDERKRTYYYIDWAFRFILYKYKRDVFMKRSINHILHFIYLNRDKWVHDPSYHPDNWFGKKRGRLLSDLYGGLF